MEDYRPSIINYHSVQRRIKCGYCSTSEGSLVYGLTVDVLKPEDYQNMIDRGWRRSCNFVYRSIMQTTCCPAYTIRCAAKDFKLSKTQKRIIKKFNNFLTYGVVTKDKFYRAKDITQPMEMFNAGAKSLSPDRGDKNSVMLPQRNTVLPKTDNSEKIQSEVEYNKPAESSQMNFCQVKEQTNKSKCMKAKYLRIERKRQKLQKLGLSEEEISKKLVEKKKYPVVKTLEDHLNESSSGNKVHNLKMLLVRSSPRSKEFDWTFSDAFDLYKRYQSAIHKDPPEEVTESQFEDFLINSPLQASNKYGSYHQQYWLDNKLIAVGVLDILPKCVSSVYFFYDPDYSHLCLGTYGALREVEFTRKLSRHFPDLCYYYMGLYIHSCVKMKYKGAFKPSYLLCPEAYTWHPIQECIKKLEITKYSRLNENANAKDEDSNFTASDVLILYRHTVMTLADYMKTKKCSAEELDFIMEYAKLLGKKCTRKMLLFRK